MLFLDDGQKLDFVDRAFRGLAGWICQLIYRIVAGLFELFINISKVEVLSPNGPEIKQIYQRVTMILTIIMVFYVMFEFIKYIIQPDQMTDKEKGASKILTKMVIVVVLLAFVPDIFSMAYKLQNAIVDRQILSKVILGKEGVDGSNFGRSFSASVLHEFYYYDEDYWGDKNGERKCVCESKTGGLFGYDCKVPCKAIVNANLNSLAQDGDLPMLTTGLGDGAEHTTSTGEKVLTPYITFDGLFALAVGGFLIYVLVLYCIDVGTRVFQLLFLQIIAPIPIIGYLSPNKDNMFTKWVKQCMATYLDLFLRLAIIYFALFICQILSTARQTGKLFANVSISSGTSKTLIYIALIMGLLLFAQRAPKLLEELFPKMKTAASGNFGLKTGERVAPAAARALGVGLGATKLAGNLYRRAAWAHARNKANGQKSVLTKEGRQQFKERQQARKEARKAQQDYQRYGKDSKTQQEFNEARNKWNEKRKNATGQIENDIRNLRKEEKKAREMGDDVAAEMYRRKIEEKGAELRKVNQGLESSEEFKRWDRARKTMQGTNTTEYARQSAERLRTTRENQKRADKEFTDAEKELNDAKASGDAHKIAMAQQRFNNADKRKKAADKEQEIAENDHKKIVGEKGQGGMMFGDYKEQSEQLKQKAEQATEEYVDLQNRKHQGAAGVLASAAAGTAKTMWAGGHATKLEDVTKKVHEGVEADKKSVKAVQQYYDTGGTGWVDRTVQQVQKSLGGPTAYEQTMLQTRAIEPKIKRLEAQSSLVKTMVSSGDGAEDRLKSKIDDLKVVATSNTIKTGLKNADGSSEYVTDVQPGETLGSLHRRYVGLATSAQASSDNAAKNLQTYETENAIKIANGDAEAIAEQSRLKAEANAKAKEAADAKYRAEQIQKNAARYEYTQILSDFATGKSLEEVKNKDNGIYDAPAVESTYSMLEAMKVMRSNPTIVEDVRRRLGDQKNAQGQNLFELFMSGKIADFESFDTIKNAAIAAQNEYDRERNSEAERKRSIETSNQTSAEKAANDFNESGK